MVRWRIYYDFGVYDWTSLVEYAPCDGVLIIVQEDNAIEDQPYTRGRELLYGKDFYWWDGKRWLGGDRYGLEDYLRQPGWKKIVAGRTVPYATFQRVKAIAEQEFPQTANG